MQRLSPRQENDLLSKRREYYEDPEKTQAVKKRYHNNN